MIYLVGGSGYVGNAFQRYFTARNVSYSVVSRSKINYYDVSRLISIIRSEKPSFLINTAGFVGVPNVDACEIQKYQCLWANAVLPGVIAQACEATGLSWGHVSSGCIFSGTRPDGQGFVETDAPNFTFRQDNCSFYSGTKAMGEEIIEGIPNVYLWRVRMPFNEVEEPKNYLSKVMTYDTLLNATNSLSQLDEFVAASMECWRRGVPFGTYNMTNPGYVSTREVVQMIKKELHLKKRFTYFKNEDDFLNQAAIAPRSSCVLSSNKLASMGIQMTEVHDAIKRDLQRWKKR